MHSEWVIFTQNLQYLPEKYNIYPNHAQVKGAAVILISPVPAPIIAHHNGGG